MEPAVLEKPVAPVMQDVIEAHFDGNHENAQIYLVALNKAKKAEAKKARAAEFKRQSEIFHHAQNIGATYYEASKKLPGPEVLNALYENGYAPAPEEYLSGIFYDLEDYHAHILLEVEDRAAGYQKQPMGYRAQQDTARYRKEVLAASKIEGPEEPEYYYHTEKRKVIVLGKTAIKEFEDSESRTQIERLLTQQRLIIGTEAEEYEKAIIYKKLEVVRELGQLLVDKTVQIKRVEKRDDYTAWKAEDFLAYGIWLSRVVEPAGGDITYDLLGKAYQLGLGPGIKTIIKYGDFENCTDYLRRLGRVNRSGSFDSWSFDDYVNHLREVIAQTDKRVTKKILLERIRQGKDEPSPPVIASNTQMPFSAVLEAAGQPTYNKKVTSEVCINSVVEFEKQTGRRPKSADFKSSSILCGEATMYRLFGTLEQMNRTVNGWLEDQEENSVSNKAA